MGIGLKRRLALEGCSVVHHNEMFAPGTADAEWLPVVGKRRLIVLTKDSRIRYRPIEKKALIEAGVRAFVFTGGNTSGADMAVAIVKALPKVRKLLEQHSGPFVARITPASDVAIIFE